MLVTNCFDLTYRKQKIITLNMKSLSCRHDKPIPTSIIGWNRIFSLISSLFGILNSAVDNSRQKFFVSKFTKARRTL